MSLYHNAVSWSAVCDFGISWSYSLAFYARSLFYCLVIGVLSSLAINLLRKKTLVDLIQFKVFGSCLSVLCLIIIMLWVGLLSVIMAFPGHTHLL